MATEARGHQVGHDHGVCIGGPDQGFQADDVAPIHKSAVRAALDKPHVGIVEDAQGLRARSGTVHRDGAQAQGHRFGQVSLDQGVHRGGGLDEHLPRQVGVRDQRLGREFAILPKS